MAEFECLRSLPTTTELIRWSSPTTCGRFRTPAGPDRGTIESSRPISQRDFLIGALDLRDGVLRTRWRLRLGLHVHARWPDLPTGHESRMELLFFCCCLGCRAFTLRAQESFQV